MASEGTTPLAPPQGVAANGAEGAPPESLAGLILRSRAVRFTLRRSSGAVVGDFFGLGVEEFAQYLDEGRIRGVTRARTGNYVLLWGTTELNDGRGQWSCDYDMPDGAEVTLLLRRTDTVADP